jgi:3'-5' exoribonuclease
MSDYHNVQEVKAIDPAIAAPFRCILILRRKHTKTAKNGNPFLSIELGDSGGSFTANCFSDSAIYKAIEKMDEGSILRVAGKTEYYNDRFSPRLQSAEQIDLDEAEAEGVAGELVETPPETEETLWQTLQDAVAVIQHPQLKETVERVLEEVGDHFRVCPAAISMHHAYRNGLLEHTVHMLQAARALLPVYPQVDPDLALAGIVLHDIGKLEEYEGDFAVKTSRIGTLQGHVVIGFRVARKAALLSSHQGEKEWGAAAMAATPEAVFVSMVDNLDAKMGMVQRVLRNAPEGDTFSDFLPGLQTRVLLTQPDKS